MLVPALLVLVLALLLGGAFVLTRPAQWTASASFAVLPSAGDAETEAGYYETLSRGQIVSTIAEVLAARAQGLPDGVDVDVEVLPETSLVRMTTTASTSAEATEVTDQQLASGIEAVRALEIPFEPRVVEQPAQTVQQVDAERPKNLAIVALGAFGAALLVQQALAQLGLLRSRRREPAPTTSQV